MRFRCRPAFIENTFQGITIVIFVLLLLVILVLVPSLIEGPDKVHYLHRTECQVKQINYIENQCLRDTSNDIFALTYKSDWEDCIIAQVELFDIKNNLNCTYILPDSFDGEIEATIATKTKFRDNGTFKCVIDTVHNQCFPDKNEILIFSLLSSSVFVIFLFFLSIYLYIRYRNNHDLPICCCRKKEEDNL